MSRPGELRDDELTVIGTGIGTKPARLANVAAAWYAKADAELRKRFGFGIDYRSTGAYRTNADTAAIPGALPDGDHERGIALDIRNWARFARVDRKAFAEILVRNGWRNIDSTGKPFPREPWHHVCTKTEPPAGGGGDDPIGDDMAQGAFYRDSKSGGIWWQERPNTPLVPIDLTTWQAYSANGNKYADLEPAAVAALRAKWGTVDAPSGAPGSLTAAEVADEIDERARKRLG